MLLSRSKLTLTTLKFRAAIALIEMLLLMHMRDSIKSAPRRKTVDKQTLRAEVFADLETALSAWWAPGDAALCLSWSQSQQLGNVCKWLDGVCGVLLTFRGMEKIKLKCKLDSRVEVVLLKTLSLFLASCVWMHIDFIPLTSRQQPLTNSDKLL